MNPLNKISKAAIGKDSYLLGLVVGCWGCWTGFFFFGGSDLDVILGSSDL